MKPLPTALLLVMCLLVSTDARAQTGSMLTGTVRDSAGSVLSDATLTLEGDKLAGDTRMARSTSRGVYRFPELPPGLYALTASLNGLQTVKRAGLRLGVGSTLTVDVVLAKVETPAVVTITGAPPAVDVTTPASTTALTSEDLMNLPIGSGAGILQIVPGVTPRTAFGSGVDTSQLTLDGGAVTVPVRNTESAAIHPYWMQEVQVAGLGANAEYGVFSGLTANIALRSGSRRFSGLFEYRVSPSGWVGDNTGELPEEKREGFRPDEILSRWNGHALMGGPVIRERLFFFSGFEDAKNEILQAGTIGDAPRDERSPAFLTHLAWAPSRNLRVDGFLEADRTLEVGMVGLNARPETANDRSWGTRSGNVRALWTVNSGTLLEVRGGAVDFTFEGLPAARRAGPPPHSDDKTGINSGNVQQFQDIFTDRFVTGATVTRFLDGVGGRGHTLKSGVEIERTTYRQVTGFPGGQQFFDEEGVPKIVKLWEGDRVSSTGTRTTLFLQDAWSLARRVTIHPGVRLSLNRGSVPDKGSVFRTNPLSPRIGVAWDVSAHHTTVVRGSYGRFHEGLYTSLFNFMNTAERHPVITMNVVGDALEEATRTTVDSQAIDDNLAHAYVDQYLVGIERELFQDFSLVLQYIGRTFGDIWALTDTGSRYAPVERLDPGPDNRPNTADDGPVVTVFNLLNPGESFTVLSNPDDAFRRYHAFQAIGQKRFSRHWQLLAAYTWSKTHGNVSAGSGENRAAGSDTGATGVFFNPNRAINAAGPVSSDFTHQLDLQAVYNVPMWGGVAVSAAYRFLSGGAAGRTAAFTKDLTQGRQVVRVEPRGTRRIDSASVLDVRIEKTFPLRRSGPTLGIYVDLLNAMNRGVPLAATIDERSGGTYGDPTSWADPRTVRIAGRLRF